MKINIVFNEINTNEFSPSLIISIQKAIFIIKKCKWKYINYILKRNRSEIQYIVLSLIIFNMYIKKYLLATPSIRNNWIKKNTVTG